MALILASQELEVERCGNMEWVMRLVMMVRSRRVTISCNSVLVVTKEN